MYKIMIVDDSSLIRRKMKLFLSNKEFEVVGEAENGIQAISVYKECNPDIVTLDITMPVMGGLETASKILALNKDAKIIMVSAMGQKEIIIDAVKIGIKHFIVKPFIEEELIKIINDVILFGKKS